MEHNLGVQGAKQQTWVQDNPRALLKRLSDENPGLAETALRALFVEALYKDPLTHIAALVAYWWPANFRSLSEPAKPRQKTAGPTTAELVAVMKSRLMVLVLSNGKALKDCTFGELDKEGGWLKDLAKMGKRDEVVGQKLTLDQVAAAWPAPATQ